MSTSLGDMVVSFGADVSGLSAGVNVVKGMLGSLPLPIAGLVGGFIALGAAGVDLNAKMEQMQVAFKTVFGSAAAAKDELQQLTSFAAKTPFQVMDLDATAAKLRAFGEQKNVIIPDLTAIGDTLSALGETTPAKLQQVANIFGKIDTTGKLTTGIMTQLSRNGINAWQALSDATGKPIAMLQQMVHKGLIPAKDATADLRKGLEMMYGGGMANQAQTFNGLMSTLKDNLGQALRSFSGPLFDAAKGALTQIGNIAGSSKFQDFATAMGKDMAGAFGNLGKALQPALPMFQDLQHFFSTLDLSGLSSNFGKLSGAVQGLLGPFKGVKLAMPGPDFWNSVDVGIKGLISGGIGTLGNIFSGLASAIKSATPTIQQIAGIVGGAFSQHMKTASSTVQDLGKWFNTSLKPALKDAMPGFQALASTVMTTLVPGLVKLWAIGQSVSDKVMPVLVKIFEKATPIIIRIAGAVDGGLAAALKFLMPYILQAAQAIGDFAGEIADRVLPIVSNFFDALNQAMPTLQAIWSATWPVISGILQGAWEIMSGIVKVAWSLISGIIKIGLDVLSGNWKGVWNDLKSMLSGVWDGMKSLISGALRIIGTIIFGAGAHIQDMLIAPFQAAWDTIGGIFNNIQNGISNALGGVGSLFGIGGHARGIMNSPTTHVAVVGEEGPEIMVIPQGASVYPHGQYPSSSGAAMSSGSSSGGSSGGTQTIQIFLDGMLIGQVTGNAQAALIQLKTGVRQW